MACEFRGAASSTAFSRPVPPVDLRADPGAPLPTGTAYCLIHKFSKEQDWRQTLRDWHGSPSEGGRLLLNNNDNNPYNGDPAKQWRVVINVKRANAAAVGIYI